MDYAEFVRLVGQLSRKIPAEYLDGVAAVDVSPKTLPDPVHAGVYTLGECIPLDLHDDLVTSRIVLFHGSFAALARGRPDFPWREEAWETLTHEVRHHLEWRANVKALERYDWAAEQNRARVAGERFDPVFHLSGERLAEDVYKVDDDVFLDRPVRRLPERAAFTWHGREYEVAVPAGLPPVFLTVDGVRAPPPGDLVLALRRKTRMWDLFKRARAPVVAVGRPTSL